MKSTKNDIFIIKIDKLLILKVLFFALKGINKNCLTLNALGGVVNQYKFDYKQSQSNNFQSETIYSLSIV